MDTKTIQDIQALVEEVLARLGIENVTSTVEVDESQVVRVNINSPDNEEGQNMGILIGRGGETLHALQLILALMINKGKEEWLQISVDVNNYRDGREESLRAMAMRMKEKTLFLKEAVPLPPMNAMDRRIVHMALSEIEEVETESTGTGRSRRVIVKPA